MIKAADPIVAATMFSGIGAPECGMPHWDWRWCAEIEKFPSAVLATRHPQSINLGDINAEDFVARAEAIGRPDILVFGSPCFVAGTLVATARGLIPIETVRSGELVLTHKQRWRRVLAVGGRRSVPTIKLSGQGMCGIVTTSEHPFYARQKFSRSTREKGKAVRKTWFSQPGWTDAENMQSCMWAVPSKVEPLSIPVVEYAHSREMPVDTDSPAFWRFVGRWLADGWLRRGQRTGRPNGEAWGVVFLCCAPKERQDCEELLRDANLKFSISVERTTIRFQIHRKALSRWLLEHFGQYAGGKRLAGFALGMEEINRKALLAGYLSGDGSVMKNGSRASTVSKSLAVGMGMLAASLGKSYSITFSKPKRDRCVIEGRIVSERGFWQLLIYDHARSAFFDNGYMWGLVRSVEPEGVQDVFNLEVEEDNSYTADGVCVHNCQDFSVAGRRVGLDGDRGNLALVALGIVNRIRPRWVCFENVPGLLSSRSGSAEAERQVREGPVGGRADSDEDSDFAAFLALVQQCGYFGCYRITDAQYAGVPQRRRRIFAVFHIGDWRPAAAVLLEPESLRGDHPPSRETGERIAPTISSRPTGGGGLGTDFDLDGGLDESTVEPGLHMRGMRGDEHSDMASNVRVVRSRTGGIAQNPRDVPEVAYALQERDSKGQDSNTKEGHLIVADVAPTLVAGGNKTGGTRYPGTKVDEADGLIISFDCKAGGETSFAVGDQAGAQRASHGGGHSAIAFDTTQITSRTNRSNPQPDDPSPPVTESGHPPTIAFSSKDYGGVAAIEQAPTLRAMEFDGSHANGGGQIAVAFQTRGSNIDFGDISGTIGTNADRASGSAPMVFKSSHFTRGKDGAPSGISPPLGAEPDKGDQDPILMAGTAVRRLTPVECERLQAFPDSYTDILFRGKPASDGPRYKSLGNAMNVKEIQWVLQRIERFEKEKATW